MMRCSSYEVAERIEFGCQMDLCFKLVGKYVIVITYSIYPQFQKLFGSFRLLPNRWFRASDSLSSFIPDPKERVLGRSRLGYNHNLKC
jgi:hypothetical protein